MSGYDIRVVHTTIELPCCRCGELIPIGAMVHYLARRQVAHVACDLRARDALRWAETS